MKVGAFDIVEPAPELNEPHALAMLRPWVDVGSVGSLSLARLERHFHAKKLGEIERPGNFFDFTRYRPVISTRRGKREITIPNSSISYAKRDEGHDFIFLHLLEPHMFGEDYTDSIVQLLRAFNVRRYALIGGMYDAVPHTRPLLVTGSVAGARAQEEAESAKVEQSSYEGPTTINYLVNQELQKLGVETASLIVHLPQYAQLEEDFTGMSRLLKALASMYNLPDYLANHKKGEAQYQDLSRMVSDNPRLQPVIQQLEANYDSRGAGDQPSGDEPKLAPEVEDFLREMDEKFEAGPDQAQA